MLEEYAVKVISEVWYVIHIETGCTIPKNGFKMSHEDYWKVPSFKRRYFVDYYMMTRAKRKSRIKQMKSTDYRSNYDTLKMHQTVPTDSFKVFLSQEQLAITEQ
jgi:hypothetical protein